jgi:hypothetical protein
MDEQAETPEHDAGSGGFDRRKLLQGAAMAGAAAWVVPSVLSLSALPAAASGLIFDAKTQSSNITTVTEVDFAGSSQWLLQGVVVVTIAIDSYDQVITPPDGDWSVVYSTGTSTGTTFMAATFVRNYFAVASYGAFPYRFTWTNAARMTAAYTSFGNATTVQAVSATPTLTTSTSVTAATVTVTDDGGVPQDYRQLMWAGAYSTYGASLTARPTLPTTTNTDLFASVANGRTGVGQFYGSFAAPNPQVVGDTSGTLSAARPNLASMLVIY